MISGIIYHSLFIISLLILTITISWVVAELKPMPISKAVFWLIKEVTDLSAGRKVIYTYSHKLDLIGSKTKKISIFTDCFVVCGERFGLSVFEIKRLVRYLDKIDSE